MVHLKERFHIFVLTVCTKNTRKGSPVLVPDTKCYGSGSFQAVHLLRVYKSDALSVMATSQRPLPQTKLAL